MKDYGNAHRQAFATGISAAVSGQNGFVCLYNNSPGVHVMVLWGLNFDPRQNGYNGMGVVQTGSVGSSPVSGIAAFTGDSAPVGQAFTGSTVTASLPTFNIFLGGSGFYTQLPARHPIIVLNPGWSITFWDSSANDLTGVTYYYEWAYAWEFPIIDNEEMARNLGELV